MSELDELLARAIELDHKAASGELTDDELATELDELAADAELAAGLDINEPAPDDDDLELGEGGDEWAGVADPDDLEETGVDFDEPDDEPVLERAEDPDRVTPAEEKAAGWARCPSCGSTERDEFTDDTARCSDCGTILSPAVAKKGFDFDEEPDDATGPEVKSGLDGLEVVDDFDLLRARRLELG